MDMSKMIPATIGLSYLFLCYASLAALAVKYGERARRRQRRWKTRPINKRRAKEGLFATLIKDMWHLDDDMFFKSSRMTQQQFEFLLYLISADIQKDKKKQHITPAERLIITLHYLSEGCSMQEIAWGYRIGKATAHVIIKETCEVLWNRLVGLELPVPTEQSFREIETSFFQRRNLPNCIGAVDGDSAFPLHENILRPYPGSYSGEKKNIFNYRLSRGCRCIENAFGILSQRWRVLRRLINASIEVAELIVQATIILHNFLQSSEKDILPENRKYCPTGYADYYDENGVLHEGAWRLEGPNLRSMSRLGSNNSTNRAKNNRDILADYFLSKEGWVPWQENILYRGGMPPL